MEIPGHKTFTGLSQGIKNNRLIHIPFIFGCIFPRSIRKQSRHIFIASPVLHIGKQSQSTSQCHIAQRISHIPCIFGTKLLLYGKLTLVLRHISGFNRIAGKSFRLFLLFFGTYAHLLGHSHLEYRFFALLLGNVFLLISYVFHLFADTFHHIRLTFFFLILIQLSPQSIHPPG